MTDEATLSARRKIVVAAVFLSEGSVPILKFARF